jgi:uncharacterized protein (DUF58 family)
MNGARSPDGAWTARARVAGQLFRIASLLAPTAIAWGVLTKLGDRNAPVHPAVGHALALLWCALLVAFLAHVAAAITRHRRSPRWTEAGLVGPRPSLLDRIDILTPSGAGLSWLGAGALVLSTRLEWSSVSLVGMIGLGFFHFVAIWATLAASGGDPWRRGSLVRRFTTERAVEGDPVIEEVCFSAPRIPTGFRLFARGRVGPRWPVSRYVVEGQHDGSELRLQADVGPAVRGAYDAEPLEVWLQDVFGLCRSMSVFAGVAPLVVLPRERALRGHEELLRAHGEIDEPRAAVHRPTEGSMQLREYTAGDDARRIHWARSLSTGQTIVRTPDEVPHDQRSVRVVLDTHLPGAQDLTCDAPAELLDTLVALWIGVARTFAAAGMRVDLVFAGPDRVVVTPLPRGLGRVRGLQGPAEEIAARAQWQSDTPLERVLTRHPTVVVSYRHQPLTAASGTPMLWVLAREWSWVRFDRSAPETSLVCLPHPVGSPENQLVRRRREQRSYARARADHARFAALCIDPPRSGWEVEAPILLATPSLTGGIDVERLS